MHTSSDVEQSTWILIFLNSGSVSETSGSLSTVALFPGGESFFLLLEFAEPPIGFADPPSGLPTGFADDPYPLAEDPGSC